MFAAREGHTAIVKALIGCGADIHTVDENGQTAFSYATAMDHSEVIEALAHAGAEDTGTTPPTPTATPQRSAKAQKKKKKGKGKGGKGGKGGKKSARAHEENAVHLSGAKASPTSVTASPGDA